MLFAEDDLLAREAGRLIEDLARRGRGFGIHLLLSSQSPAMPGLYGKGIYEQMGLRIAFRCSPQVSQAILGEANTAAAQLSESGQAIYNEGLGDRAANREIRVSLLPAQERRPRIGGISQSAGRPALSYTGDLSTRSPAHLAANAEWQAVLDAGPATQAAIQATEVDEPVKIWLGEPVAIKPPTSALLERYEGSNLLIVGSDEQQAYGLLLAAVYSLAAQRSPQQARFVIADFSRPSTRFFGVFGRLDLPHGLDVLTARRLRVQPPASPFPPAGAGPETRPRRSLLAAAPPVGGSLSSQPEPSLPTTPPSPLQALEALIEARWVALESGQPLADDQDVYLILAGMHGWPTCDRWTTSPRRPPSKCCASSSGGRKWACTSSPGPTATSPWTRP